MRGAGNGAARVGASGEATCLTRFTRSRFTRFTRFTRERVAAISRLLRAHRHLIDDDRAGAEAGVDVGRRRGLRFVGGHR